MSLQKVFFPRCLRVYWQLRSPYHPRHRCRYALSAKPQCRGSWASKEAFLFLLPIAPAARFCTLCKERKVMRILRLWIFIAAEIDNICTCSVKERLQVIVRNRNSKRLAVFLDRRFLSASSQKYLLFSLDFLSAFRLARFCEGSNPFCFRMKTKRHPFLFNGAKTGLKPVFDSSVVCCDVCISSI